MRGGGAAAAEVSKPPPLSALLHAGQVQLLRVQVLRGQAVHRSTLP